jgi:hypothetical protein
MGIEVVLSILVDLEIDGWVSGGAIEGETVMNVVGDKTKGGGATHALTHAKRTSFWSLRRMVLQHIINDSLDESSFAHIRSPAAQRTTPSRLSTKVLTQQQARGVGAT